MVPFEATGEEEQTIEALPPVEVDQTTGELPPRAPEHNQVNLDPGAQELRVPPGLVDLFHTAQRLRSAMRDAKDQLVDARKDYDNAREDYEEHIALTLDAVQRANRALPLFDQAKPSDGA